MLKIVKIFRHGGAYRCLKAEQRVRTRGTALRRHRMVVRSPYRGDWVVISVDAIDKALAVQAMTTTWTSTQMEIRRHPPSVLIYKLLHLDITEDS
jgi:hypothetical protein